MDFTPAERDVIAGHASALGLSPDQYIRQTAVTRALVWQRELEALQTIAQHRGCTIEDLVRRGTLTDVGL